MSAAHLSTGMTARRSNSSRDFIELSLDSNLFLQLQALSPCQGRSELQCQECVILNVDSIMDPRTQKQETLLTGFPARYTGARSSITIPIQAHLPGSVDRLRPIRASSTETSKSILIKFPCCPRCQQRGRRHMPMLPEVCRQRPRTSPVRTILWTSGPIQ